MGKILLVSVVVLEARTVPHEEAEKYPDKPSRGGICGVLNSGFSTPPNLIFRLSLALLVLASPFPYLSRYNFLSLMIYNSY